MIQMKIEMSCDLQWVMAFETSHKVSAIVREVFKLQRCQLDQWVGLRICASYYALNSRSYVENNFICLFPFRGSIKQQQLKKNKHNKQEKHEEENKYNKGDKHNKQDKHNRKNKSNKED